MNTEKGTLNKTATADLSKFCRSKFTLTFAVEVLGLEDFEVWEDCCEGWIQQGPCVQGLKLQCFLYPGQVFDLDVMMWPHVAKIWCGVNYGFVRTWRFLERRWLAFTISYAFPVRVVDLQNYVATITPTFGTAAFGTNAKSDKNIEVYLPPLKFGMRRYFAPVLETETENIVVFITNMIWKKVEEFIPGSCFDELFDVPHEVTDVRHQDACLDRVRDLILGQLEPVEIEIEPPELEEDNKKHKSNKKELKLPKEKEKKILNFGFGLPGENILSGTGRIVSFETVGDRPPDSPEIIVLISSYNLPAQDDLPIIFLNVENLIQIPLNEFKILRITQLYVKWKVGEIEHCSEPQPLKTKTTVNFHDHRAFPVPYEILPKVTSQFLDTCFNIELRGIRLPAAPKEPRLFGYEKNDRDFDRTIPKLIKSEELDFIIAVTHINGRHLAKGINAFLSGEYPLYPPRVTAKLLQREVFCTNDINAIRLPVEPDLVVRPYVILQAQMSLEASIGVVGCKPRKLPECYSRMFCTIRDSEAITTILRNIATINDEVKLSEKKENLMSGFALDTGSVVVLYVEGPRDGQILRIWDMTEDYYPKVKPVFSCSDRYSTRLYPEMIVAAVPFLVLKMFVPLGVLLACPPVYARPALPLPTRSALLKFCDLISYEFSFVPSRCKMPTAAELKSFKLELCAPPRPNPVVINENTLETRNQVRHSQQSVSRINWDK